jgi:ribosome-binding protein aMBF1 (putative translation factor)
MDNICNAREIKHDRQKRNGSHISENYRKILRKRFEVMGESYKELEKLIEELDSTFESIDLRD